MKETRRESVISTNDIEDEFDATSISYHIQNLDQMKYWLQKNEVSSLQHERICEKSMSLSFVS